jgi:hypothetical protein
MIFLQICQFIHNEGFANPSLWMNQLWLKNWMLLIYNNHLTIKYLLKLIYEFKAIVDLYCADNERGEFSFAGAEVYLGKGRKTG